MQNQYKYVIGLMSGTSLDGLDLVYVKFNQKNYKDFQILQSSTKSYSLIARNDELDMYLDITLLPLEQEAYAN